MENEDKIKIITLFVNDLESDIRAIELLKVRDEITGTPEDLIYWDNRIKEKTISIGKFREKIKELQS